MIFFIVFGFEFRIIRLFVDDKLINQKKFIFFPEVDPVLLSLCLLSGLATVVHSYTVTASNDKMHYPALRSRRRLALISEQAAQNLS